MKPKEQIKILADCIIEMQKYGELCPQTMEQLRKIAGDKK